MAAETARAPFTWNSPLSMRIYDILFNIAKSINCPKNSLARSLTLSQGL